MWTFSPLVAYKHLREERKEVTVRTASDSHLHGGEVYYNAEITPWFHLTGDLQVINPGPQALDTAVVLGLRAKIDF